MALQESKKKSKLKNGGSLVNNTKNLQKSPLMTSPALRAGRLAPEGIAKAAAVQSGCWWVRGCTSDLVAVFKSTASDSVEIGQLLLSFLI